MLASSTVAEKRKLTIIYLLFLLTLFSSLLKNVLMLISCFSGHVSVMHNCLVKNNNLHINSLTAKVDKLMLILLTRVTDKTTDAEVTLKGNSETNRFMA